MQLIIKFHGIPSISFCTNAAAKFVSDTDRQQTFSKNCVQDILKHVKPSETGYPVFSGIQYFLLMYVEESKKEKR